MKLRTLNSVEVARFRRLLLAFLKHHGDQRITHMGLNWLKQADQTQLSAPGTLVLAALDGKKLIGLLIVAEYGLCESYMAVHAQYRNQDIAKQMIQKAIEILDKIYGRIALDNIPSLKACFSNGMVAFHLFTGPTGKPTLWLGGGNWNREDVLAYS